jgi:hypothetical protein
VSQAEFGTGQSAAKLLDSLLHSAGDTASASTDLSQASSAPGIANKTAPGGISTEEMDKLLANLKDSDPGDVANAPAMIRLQQSTNLHAALTDLLQATHEPQGNGGASTTGTPS